MHGLLNGIRVLEFSGLAPGPFCGKILADFGANVIRLDKPSSMETNWLNSNKKSILLNLKKLSNLEAARKLCLTTDILIDPYRPGVLEKLNLGPQDLMAENRRLIYARLSGFGQSGPMKNLAGHDINYLALSGVLSMLGRANTKPTPPINLLADFAGGGLLCALGIVLSLYDRTQTGNGQLVDLSMSEGAAYVSSWLYSSKNSFLWGNERGKNWLDSGAHFYDTYETKDSKFMAVGSIEPQFYFDFIKALDLNPHEAPQLGEFEPIKQIFKEKFKTKTQQEWMDIFKNVDACVTPVLSLDEAPLNFHNISRKNFRKVKNSWEPTAAPRLTDMDLNLHPILKETQKDEPSTCKPGQHTNEILSELGYSKENIDLISEESNDL